MLDDEWKSEMERRQDRTERMWLISTRDAEGYLGVNPSAAVEMERLTEELRVEHKSVRRSFGQLILDPA